MSTPRSDLMFDVWRIIYSARDDTFSVLGKVSIGRKKVVMKVKHSRSLGVSQLPT